MRGDAVARHVVLLVRSVTALTVPSRLAKLAQAINEERSYSIALMTRGTEHARRVGELLMDVKDLLPHGAFQPWLSANCAMSRRSAQNYMRLARHWNVVQAKTQRIACLAGADVGAHVGIRQALYFLTAPETVEDEDDFRRVDVDLPTDYQCPCGCRYEWSGSPTPNLPTRYACPCGCLHEWSGQPKPNAPKPKRSE